MPAPFLIVCSDPQIPSPFASADFALNADGKWWLLEVGDGQVSGLPDPKAAGAVFAALAKCAGVRGVSDE